MDVESAKTGTSRLIAHDNNHSSRTATASSRDVAAGASGGGTDEGTSAVTSWKFLPDGAKPVGSIGSMRMSVVEVREA